MRLAADTRSRLEYLERRRAAVVAALATSIVLVSALACVRGTVAPPELYRLRPAPTGFAMAAMGGGASGGTMLAALTSETLGRDPALAGRVRDGAPAAGSRGLRWRGVVREFEEVDRGAAVSVAVRLDARLERIADDSLLWSGSARAEAPVGRSTDMTAVVDSLSSLASRAVASLARDASPALRGAVAP
jgi:hypothetical protein